MKIQKPDRLVGYVLLIIGVILILIPVLMAILMLFGAIPSPIYVQTPPDITDQSAKVIADTFPLLNIIPTFLLFVVLVYAGSEFMGKGVGLIKEISWKVIKTPEKETETTEETIEPEQKTAKKTKKED